MGISLNNNYRYNNIDLSLNADMRNTAQQIKESAQKAAEQQSNKREKDMQIQQESMKLKRIEENVKMHEMAHMAAGGGLAGSPSFEYQTGPDGRQYIVGGEVPIVIKEGRTPEETVMLMEQVRAAALAPAEPSSADRAVAAKAAAIAMKAQQEMADRLNDKGDQEKRVSLYA